MTALSLVGVGSVRYARWSAFTDEVRFSTPILDRTQPLSLSLSLSLNLYPPRSPPPLSIPGLRAHLRRARDARPVGTLQRDAIPGGPTNRAIGGLPGR